MQSLDKDIRIDVKYAYGSLRRGSFMTSLKLFVQLK